MIKRVSLPEELSRRLQQQISLGNIRAGEKLPTEPELMQQFGVSRSTVREAVRILSNAGWIKVRQGLGTFVSPKMPDSEPLTQRLRRVEPQHLLEVRLMLEHKVAEKAAQNRSASDLVKMRADLAERKRLAHAGEWLACIDADIRFHTHIAQASGNDILADLYKAFAEQLKESFLAQFENTDSFVQTQTLHENLLAAIEEQDAEQAWYWARQIVDH